MDLSYTTFVLYHYGRRYIERIGTMPTERDLDPVLARTLLTTTGSIGNAIRVLDEWFHSSDPWYAKEGFQFAKCFMAMNRLFAQGDIEPKGSVTSEQRDLCRKLAIELFLKPTLRLVRSENEPP
jgi:hypothetical protein